MSKIIFMKNFKIFKTSLFSFFLIFLQNQYSFSDTVILKQGNVVQGKILKLTDELLSINSSLGLLNIRRQYVISFRKDEFGITKKPVIYTKEQIKKMIIKTQVPEIKTKKKNSEGNDFYLQLLLGYGLNNFFIEANKKLNYENPQSKLGTTFLLGIGGQIPINKTFLITSGFFYQKTYTEVLWKKDSAIYDWSEIYLYEILTVYIGLKAFFYDRFYSSISYGFNFHLSTAQVEIDSLGNKTTKNQEDVFLNGKVYNYMNLLIELGYSFKLSKNFLLETGILWEINIGEPVFDSKEVEGVESIRSNSFIIKLSGSLVL